MNKFSKIALWLGGIFAVVFILVLVNAPYFKETSSTANSSGKSNTSSTNAKGKSDQISEQNLNKVSFDYTSGNDYDEESNSEAKTLELNTLHEWLNPPPDSSFNKPPAIFWNHDCVYAKGTLSTSPSGNPMIVVTLLLSDGLSNRSASFYQDIFDQIEQLPWNAMEVYGTKKDNYSALGDTCPDMTFFFSDNQGHDFAYSLWGDDILSHYELLYWPSNNKHGQTVWQAIMHKFSPNVLTLSTDSPEGSYFTNIAETEAAYLKSCWDTTGEKLDNIINHPNDTDNSVTSDNPSDGA